MFTFLPYSCLKSDSHLPKKKIICINDDSPSKTKNAFCFVLKALFVLKTFRSSRKNGLIIKRLILKLMTSQLD